MDDNEKELRRAVGRRLRLARRLVELTQEEVAAAAGVSRSMVALVEQGTNGIDVYRLRRMAAAVGMELTELFDDPRGGR
jgi:transcriptional regulator with XRE-family HTH domain